MARQLTQIPANRLRHRHYVKNPATSLYERSLLIETARSNAWDQPEAIDHANWTKTRCTVTQNATSGPNGVASVAEKIVEDNTASSTHFVSRNLGGTPSDNVVQPLSFYFKAAERSVAYISTVDKANVTQTTWFDLSAGTVGTNGHGTGNAFVEVLGNGWHRCGVKRDVGTGATTPSCSFGPTTADNVTSYSGDGASGIYVFGAQHEVDGRFWTSYCGTVSRLIDDIYQEFLAPPQEMTGYVRFFELGHVLQVTPGAGIMLIGTENPVLLVYSDPATSNRYRVTYRNPSATEFSSVMGTAPVYGDLVELRWTFSATGVVQIHQSINNASETSGTASAAGGMPGAWGGTKKLLYGTHSAGSSAPHMGAMGLTHLLVEAGTHDRATMRTLAGVS